MSRVVLNGQSFDIPDGANVSIQNNVVYVDGKRYFADKTLKLDTLVFEGPVGAVKVDQGSVTVSGSVEGDVAAGGSVSAGTVGGNIKAGGSVSCGRVGGTVKAGGSVSCG